MPLLKASELVKPMADIAAAAHNPEAGDFFSKAERIISGINKLMDNALEMKNGGSATASIPPSPTTAVVENSPPAVFKSPELPPEARKEKTEMQINPKIIEFFSNHIDACHKENPDMPIGQVINKLPIKVSELKFLFDNFLKAKQ